MQVTVCVCVCQCLCVCAQGERERERERESVYVCLSASGWSVGRLWKGGGDVSARYIERFFKLHVRLFWGVVLLRGLRQRTAVKSVSEKYRTAFRYIPLCRKHPQLCQ